VRGLLEIKAGAADRFKVSVVSSDPIITWVSDIGADELAEFGKKFEATGAEQQGRVVTQRGAKIYPNSGGESGTAPMSLFFGE